MKRKMVIIIGFMFLLVGASVVFALGSGVLDGVAYLIPGGPSSWSLDKSLDQFPALQYTGQTADTAVYRISQEALTNVVRHSNRKGPILVARHFTHGC